MQGKTAKFSDKQNDAVKKAHKKLFDILLKKHKNINQIRLAVNVNYAVMQTYMSGEIFVSTSAAVRLCSYVDGKVLPHELRPDIFSKELFELYGVKI